jgi:fucose permease
MAGALLLLGVLLTWSSRRFEMAPQGLPAPPPGREDGGSSFVTAAKSQSLATVVNALSFVALETGIESGAGIWGFIFLTAGRGLSPASAGLAVSGYWAMMFLGRAVFGPLAETAGNARVLSGAVLGVVVGAGLMWVPGPRLLPVVAMMILGLAAAPIFPLFTLETSARLGGELTGTTRTVSLQVAASALGSAAVPGGIGLFLGAFNPRLLAPCLLALALAMWVSYRGVPHQAGDPNKVSKHPG